MLDYSAIEGVFYALLAFALIVFFVKNDEFLLLPLSFFYSSGLMRYDLIVHKKEAGFVSVAYAVNFFEMTNELALEALNYFLLGTATIVIVYGLLKLFSSDPKAKIDKPHQLGVFTKKKLGLIFGLFALYFVGTVITRGVADTLLSGGNAVSQGISYVLLFGFAVGGCTILLFLAYFEISFKRSGLIKFVIFVFALYAAFASYNPIFRFIVVSWVVAVGIMFLKDAKPARRLFLIAVGGIVLSLGLAMAANVRGASKKRYGLEDATFGERVQAAWDRMNKAEDTNMLDGFMMVLQVYPTHLPYALGMEHVEILLRPIPRALWPDKPVGGYANKLKLNENMKGGTVGISPSVYGSFYAEGGVYGVFFLSLLYGVLYFSLSQRAMRYSSRMRYVVKGMVYASTFALLRGGDLAGIIAFVGMTYWPVFLFMRQYHTFLKKEASEKRRAMMEERRAQAQRESQELELV